MYETNCPIPEGRCADLGYRLAVYEAGHALTARALGFKVLEIRMLPRPPVMDSDKVLRGSGINMMVEVLENRCIELFGGQIAEGHTCSTQSCCSGDVARIDELCRLIAGITNTPDPEEVWFALEDRAEALFARPGMREAIGPLAEFLFAEVEAGRPVVAGAEVETRMDSLVGPLKSRRKTLFGLSL